MEALMIIVCFIVFVYFMKQILESPDEKNNQHDITVRMEGDLMKGDIIVRMEGKRRHYYSYGYEGYSKKELLKAQKKLYDTYKAETKRENIPIAIKREVFERDGGRCVFCGSRKALHYDHIKPISKYGNNSVENIQLLCENCNLSKGARENYQIPLSKRIRKGIIDFNEYLNS